MTARNKVQLHRKAKGAKLLLVLCLVCLLLVVLLTKGRVANQNSTDSLRLKAQTLPFENPSLVSQNSVPPGIRSIVGSNEMNLADRLKAVHSLGKNLSPEEVSALYEFLKESTNPEDKSGAFLHVLKNDTIRVLRHQVAPPAGLTGTLIEIYQDESQDSVIRDYAIQHLVSWYQQGAADSPEAKGRIQAVLLDAVQKNTSIAGTALLGLHRLSASDAAFRSDKIDGIALKLAKSDAQPLTRITAIQVCSERGLKEALPKIQELAQTAENVALRISAIAALGRLGESEQVSFLEQLEAGERENINPAIQTAFNSLQQRKLVSLKNNQ